MHNFFLKSLWDDSQGQTTSDYVLMVTLVCFGAIAAMPGVAPQVYEILQFVFGREIIPNMTGGRLSLFRILSGGITVISILLLIIRGKSRQE